MSAGHRRLKSVRGDLVALGIDGDPGQDDGQDVHEPAVFTIGDWHRRGNGARRRRCKYGDER